MWRRRSRFAIRLMLDWATSATWHLPTVDPIDPAAGVW